MRHPDWHSVAGRLAGGGQCRCRVAGTAVAFYDLGGVEFGWDSFDAGRLNHAVRDGRLPQAKLARIELCCHALLSDRDAGEDMLLHRWMACTRLVEVTWEQGQAGTWPDEWGEQQARIARVRFLLAAMPEDAGVSGEGVDLVLPRRPEQMRDARRQWLATLDRYEDEPSLADLEPDEIEAQYRYVADRLCAEGYMAGGRSTRLDAEVAAFTGTHLLPRYDLARTWRLTRSRHPIAAITCLGFAAAGFVGVMVSLAVAGDPRTHLLWATACAAGVYLPLAAAAVAASPLVLHPYCLRLPAGAVIGMVAIFSTRAWTTNIPAAWQIGGLVLALLGYMALEARQHNTSPLGAVGRASFTGVVGVLHGVAVVSLALAVAGPVFFASQTTGRWGWLPQGDHHLLLTVLFLGTFGVLAGTLVQVLWSDRTVASPLDRITWKRP